MGWYTIKYYKLPEIQHQTQKQIGASSCHGPELFNVPQCGRMFAGGERGTSKKVVFSHPRFLDADTLQRTLLAFAVPHRPIPSNSACAPVLLHIIPCNPLAFNHTKARKSSRTACLFRVVCPFRLGSSQPFPRAGKLWGFTALSGTLGRSHSKPIQVHDPNYCPASPPCNAFQDSEIPQGVKSRDIPAREAKRGTSDLQVQTYLRGEKRERETP